MSSVSTGSSEATSKSRKFMFLRVGQNLFALPLSVVREVLGLGQISAIPNMPAYFAGLINLRGKIVSAVYLKKSLSFQTGTESEAKTRRPCVVITELNGRMFGAIVDDVVEVSAVQESEVDTLVDGLENKDVFVGIIKRDEQKLAPILHLERALRVGDLVGLIDKVAS